MPQLDGLRALAVGAVWLSHWDVTRLPWMSRWPLGKLGVELFFVLSGFLITGILLEARAAVERRGAGTWGAIRRFYGRRFLRIFPIYYVTLFATALLGFEGVRRWFLWHLTYTTNFHLAGQGWEPHAGGHFWTLAVEEQFYLVWPWVILLIPRGRLLAVTTTAVFLGPACRLVTTMAGGSVDAIEALPFNCLDMFALGALPAVLASIPGAGERRRLLLRGFLVVGIVGSAAMAIGFAVDGFPHLRGVISRTLTGALFAWIIAGAAEGYRGPVGRVLTLGPLVYLGKISYALYLFHGFTRPVVAGALAAVGLALPAGLLPRFVLLAGVTVAAASLTWFFFERPINDLKRRLG